MRPSKKRILKPMHEVVQRKSVFEADLGVNLAQQNGCRNDKFVAPVGLEQLVQVCMTQDEDLSRLPEICRNLQHRRQDVSIPTVHDAVDDTDAIRQATGHQCSGSVHEAPVSLSAHVNISKWITPLGPSRDILEYLIDACGRHGCWFLSMSRWFVRKWLMMIEMVKRMRIVLIVLPQKGEEDATVSCSREVKVRQLPKRPTAGKHPETFRSTWSQK